MEPHKLVLALIQAKGMTVNQAAQAMSPHAFQPTLNKFVNGKVERPSRATAETIARYLRIPIDAIYDEAAAQRVAAERGLMRGAIPPTADPSSKGVAHSVAVQAFTMPASVTWGELMSGAAVREFFVTDIPDDALAPQHPKGTRIIFKAGPTHRFGAVVLVADRMGTRHLRINAQGVGGAWSARALNPAYASLESERDGLIVLAHEWAIVTGD